MSRTFSSLANRNFRLYSVGGILTSLGTWMQRIAQDWLILQLTDNSGTALGVVTALQFLPILLFSAQAGLLADRYPKRRLLQITQAGMGVTSLALGALAVSGTVEVWSVYALALVFGAWAALGAPTRQAFVNEIVGPENVTNAIGLNAAFFNVSRMVGPALAGLLIAAFGGGAHAAGVVIALNAVNYALSLVTLQVMRPEELATPVHVARGRGMIREGVRYVRGEPHLVLILTMMFFVGTFGLNFQLFSALMATHAFGKGAGEFGLLGTSLAVGSLLGALSAARRGRPRNRLVVGAMVAFGAAIIVAAAMPTYLAFALWTPVLGFAQMTLANSANASVQLSVIPELRGRVMALYMMMVMGGTPLGAPLIGWLGQHLGARAAMASGGVLTLLGVGLAVALYLRRSAGSTRARPAAVPAQSG